MKILDLSKHQKSFDARRAAAAGVEGVLLRHAYGITLDETALGWADGIRAAGLRLGGYGFATWHYRKHNGGSGAAARLQMRRQVRAWIDATKSSGCSWWFAVDQELEAGQQMGLNKMENTRLLCEACDLLAAAGLHPCLYCSVSWEMQYVSTKDLPWPCWLARYVDGTADFDTEGAALDRLPPGTYTRWMQTLRTQGRLVGWQFASTGLGRKYGTGSDHVDRNVFYAEPGKEASLMEFTPITNTRLEVTRAASPACQAFGQPDVQNPKVRNLPLGSYPLAARGDTAQLAGMEAAWYRLAEETYRETPFVLALPDRCRVHTETVPQEMSLCLRLDVSALAQDLRRLADLLEERKEESGCGLN